MESEKRKVWVISEGKEGIGKGIIASNLASGIASRGYSVILADGGTSGGDIHTLFGIPSPDGSPGDVPANRIEKLSALLLPTPVGRLHLLGAPSIFAETGKSGYGEKKQLMEEIGSLDADYIFIDNGQGGSVDFFNLADVGIIVSSPSRASVQSTYLYLKTAMQRKILNLFDNGSPIRGEIETAIDGGGKTGNINDLLSLVRGIDEDAHEQAVSAIQDSRLELIVNVATDSDGEKISQAFSAGAGQFLRVGLPYLGRICYDGEVEHLIGQEKPFALFEDTPAADSFGKIVDSILSRQPPTSPGASPEEKKEHGTSIMQDVPPPPKFQLGLNEEIVHGDLTFHVQTEDLGVNSMKILTLVFRGGEVFYTKETEYGHLDRDDTFWEAVLERVMLQHRNTIADIKKGRLDDKISG